MALSGFVIFHMFIEKQNSCVKVAYLKGVGSTLFDSVGGRGGGVEGAPQDNTRL